MSNYSIKDLETLSGIKAHTLRIWEQRYNIISPKRTDTNIRFYDDDDLKRILNISLLNQNGFKISKIAGMSTKEINDQVFSISSDALKYPEQVQALVLSMIDIDEERFDKIVTKCVMQFGLETTMIHIIYPFLNKVGVLWQIGTINPYQEHFISSLIRQKIIVAIDTIDHDFKSNSKRFLLYLPETELHEIGLLFATYILKSRGFRVFYFGQTLPYPEFQEACEYCKPDYTFTVITSLGVQEAKNLIEKKANEYPGILHFVAGYQLPESEIHHKNVFLAETVSDFIEYLEENKVAISHS